MNFCRLQGIDLIDLRGDARDHRASRLVITCPSRRRRRRARCDVDNEIQANSSLSPSVVAQESSHHLLAL